MTVSKTVILNLIELVIVDVDTSLGETSENFGFWPKRKW